MTEASSQHSTQKEFNDSTLARRRLRAVGIAPSGDRLLVEVESASAYQTRNWVLDIGCRSAWRARALAAALVSSAWRNRGMSVTIDTGEGRIGMDASVEACLREMKGLPPRQAYVTLGDGADPQQFCMSAPAEVRDSAASPRLPAFETFPGYPVQCPR